MTQWIPCWAKKRTRRRGEPAPNPIPNPCAVLPIPCTALSRGVSHAPETHRARRCHVLQWLRRRPTDALCLAPSDLSPVTPVILPPLARLRHNFAPFVCPFLHALSVALCIPVSVQ